MRRVGSLGFSVSVSPGGLRGKDAALERPAARTSADPQQRNRYRAAIRVRADAMQFGEAKPDTTGNTISANRTHRALCKLSALRTHRQGLIADSEQFPARIDFRLRTGPGRALGAGTQSDAELRGNLACRRLGAERKYVKRIHARDTGKAGRQFAR